LLGEASGSSSSSGLLRNSVKIGTIQMVNASPVYFDFGEGVYGLQQIIALYVNGSGTQQFRAYYYDGGTTGNPPLEWLYGSGTNATIYSYNADSQFDELGNQYFGDGMKLGLKVNGTFDSGVFYIVYHRVR